MADLREVKACQVEFDGKKYTIEVQLLENTHKYLHVCVDGRQYCSIVPSSERELHTREVDAGWQNDLCREIRGALSIAGIG